MDCTKCRREPVVRPRKYPNIQGFGATCINNAKRDLRIRGLERTEEALLARLQGAALQAPRAAAKLPDGPRPEASAHRRRSPARRPPRREALARDVPRHPLELVRLTIELIMQLDDETRVRAALMMLGSACANVRESPMRPRPLALELAMQHVEQAIAGWLADDEITRAAR